MMTHVNVAVLATGAGDFSVKLLWEANIGQRAAVKRNVRLQRCKIRLGN
jgi:hypothetical protein